MRLFLSLIILIFCNPLFAFQAEYQCGDTDKGYMIELGDINDLQSKMIFDARVFKDGQLLNSDQLVAFGFGSKRSFGKNSINSHYAEVGIKTDQGIKMSKIIVYQNGVMIDMAGIELVCEKYGSKSQESRNARQ